MEESDIKKMKFMKPSDDDWKIGPVFINVRQFWEDLDKMRGDPWDWTEKSINEFRGIWVAVGEYCLEVSRAHLMIEAYSALKGHHCCYRNMWKVCRTMLQMQDIITPDIKEEEV